MKGYATSPFSNPTSRYVLRNYSLGNNLGAGSFGKVIYAVHEPTGIPVAVKVISRYKIYEYDMYYKVDREISIMQMFDHPHVIKLYEVIYTSSDIYLVMELAECGELFNYIITRKEIDEVKARYYFQQFIAAVDYLHKQVQISHRDLKSENTLINRFDNLKITDFGLSNVMLEGDFLKTSCGSPNYAAPEVVSGYQYLGCPADVWSSGCLLYTLLVGKLPFDDPYVPTLFRKIRNGEYTIPDTVNPLAADLIRQMLYVHVEKRATIDTVVSHEWFYQDLPPHLRLQFESGYETRYGLVDEYEVVNQTNQAMNTNMSLEEIKELLYSSRTKNEVAVCYRLIYDRLYEEKTKYAISIEKSNGVTSKAQTAFQGVRYETFAKATEGLSKQHMYKAFYFGVKLCPVAMKQPVELMSTILDKFRQLGWKWRLGAITAYKYYDEYKRKDLITLKLEGNKQKNPYMFSLRLSNPKNYLEYELIICCCVYVAADAKGEYQYVLDMRKVTGEITMFLCQASKICEEISEIKWKY